LPDDGQISLINSHRFISLVRSSTARNRLRLKVNFVSGFKLIWVASPGAKYFSLRKSEIVVPFRTSRSHKRGVGHRHERWAGCGGRGSAGRASVIAGQVFACERSGSRKTSGAASGRQNRVVLAPVAGVKSAEVRKARPGWQNLNPPATVTRRIRRRGERDKPLKPTRREGRIVSANL
jgi:hypothetical protein